MCLDRRIGGIESGFASVVIADFTLVGEEEGQILQSQLLKPMKLFQQKN